MFATTILGTTLSAAWTIFWVSIVFVLCLVIALWPASIAKSKGRSFWLYFLLSIFFWWITFFVVIFMKDNTKKPAPEA